MPSLRTTSRVLSLTADPARSRAESNIFINEPTSGSLARSKGSLYIVTETEGDTPGERAYCRLIADCIRSEYYRDPTQELDDAVSRGMQRGNAKMLKDERIPPPEARPVAAVTCLAIRDDELAAAQTLPVQTYIGSSKGIALVPDPPFWEEEAPEFSRSVFIGHGMQVQFQLYTAKLGTGDLVAVCSSALGRSLSIERLERWLTSGEPRQLTQGLRANYLAADQEPAYALVIQTQPDMREKATTPLSDGAAEAGAPLAGVLGRLRRPDGAPAARGAGPAGAARRGAAGAATGRRSGRERAALDARRLLLWLVLLLIVIAIIVLAIKGVQHFQAGRQHSAFVQASAQIDTMLAAAAQQQDPAAAATVLKQAETTASQDAAGLNAADGAALVGKVQAREDALVKASRFVAPKLLVDLSGDQQAELSQVVVQGDNIYMLDTGGKRVLKVTTASRTPLAVISAATTVGQDMVQPLVAIAPTPGGVLAVDSRNTLWAFDAGNNRLRRVNVPSSDSWGEVRAIATYKNELYVLDTKLNRIWRYTQQGDGYGPPSDYFAAASAQAAAAATPAATVTPTRSRVTATVTPAATVTPPPAPDLRHSVDLAVDGSLYVLQSDGSVLKFTNGLPQPFSESGLVAKMPGPSQIIANPDDSSVYVVDPSGKRLVRFSKDGAFERQYLLPPDAPLPLRDLLGVAMAGPQGALYLLGDKALGVAALPNQ